ncbi:hypothetical protein CA235_10050 [Sphingomonas sp. ABOLF]|uniref:hypothetical protein n=1 Tax=Sphingomonas sp. ABOLF TaxID=1985879 RepID=UPI000F7DF3C5|nr:hypothetical protein [Sphingomonas sp. ABOLF]RSV14859.1 hypothetical protein CA235_10050 [Sphingomonas sp. ABOLF]
MKPFTVQCEYSALHRFETTVEAEDPIAACRAALNLARRSSEWPSHCRPTPCYAVALTPGVDVDRWRDTPKGVDASVLPTAGLFRDMARVAGYAATRSEDLVPQLRIMLDAIGDDRRPRIDSEAQVRPCVTGRTILEDIEAFGLSPEATHRGEGGAATVLASPGAS